MLALYPGGKAAFLAKHGKGGGVVAAGALALGVNMIELDGYLNSSPFVDIVHGGMVTADAGGSTLAANLGSVLEADRDANGNPSHMPTGASYLGIAFDVPGTNAQRRFTYDDPGGHFSVVSTGNMSGVTIAPGSITFTPDVVQPSFAQPFIHYALSAGGNASNFQCRPVADPGGFIDAQFQTKIGRLVRNGGTVRFLKWASPAVEKNSFPTEADPYPNLKFPADGDGKLQQPIITWANRNTLASPDWKRMDGVPVEAIIRFANDLNINPWVTLPYNCADSYITGLAQAFKDGTGTSNGVGLNSWLKLYVEMSNEVWNYGYSVAHQCANEATFLGIAREVRYGQKALNAFNLITTVYGAEVSTRVVRVLAWQNAADPSVWDSMFAGVAGLQAKTDMLSTAIYYGDNADTGLPTNYTTSVATALSACQATQPAVVALAKAHKAKATSLGLRYGAYEAGPTPVFTDTAFKSSFARDPGFEGVQLNFLQECLNQLGSGTLINLFAYSYLANDSGNGYTWGICEYTYQDTAFAPKFKAQAEFGDGTRILGNLTGILTVTAGAANGTVVGPSNGAISLAGLSLFDSAGGKFGVDIATGNITVANSGAVTAGVYNITERETYALGFNSPHDTVRTIIVDAADPAWVPSSSSTPLAGWYDPSKLSTMFKDTAGTQPVTADGDLVALIKDRSGNGHDLIQATATKRPVYRTGGGKPYLQFDGVDDWLSAATAKVITDGSGQHSAAAGAYFAVNTGTQSPIDADAAVRVSQLVRLNGGHVETIAFKNDGTPFTDSGPNIAATTSLVLSERTSTTTTEAYIGGTGNGSTAVSGTMQSSAVQLAIGNSPANGQPLNGRFYGGAVYKGVISAGDHTNLVNYLQAKMP
jgi:hypothetical protein